MLLKNIYVHSLNFLNFVYIVVFDVETVLKNAKLAIIKKKEFKFFFSPPPPPPSAPSQLPNRQLMFKVHNRTHKV